MRKQHKEKVKKAVQQIGEGLNREHGKNAHKANRDALLAQVLPQNLMGMTDTTVENLYSQAYRLYNNGKYSDARDIFRLLILIKGTDVRYPLGLAACFHMMKEYEAAASIYNLCGIMDPESPVYHYHIADCYMKMEDPLSAIIALEMAVKRSEEKPQFQAIQDRSTIMIKSLKKEMKSKKTKGKKKKK